MARILIAEDERDIRDLVDFTLKFAGHEVFKVANGAEAVEMAQEVKPDLILMDVRMPRMTGYEACRALKAMDSLSAIPVVFLSAKGQDVEMKAGLEAGAIDYILKPFAPDELTRRVTEILSDVHTTESVPAIEPELEAKSEPTVAEAPPPDPAAGLLERLNAEVLAAEAEILANSSVDPDSLDTVRIDPITDDEPESDGDPGREGGPRPESQ